MGLDEKAKPFLILNFQKNPPNFLIILYSLTALIISIFFIYIITTLKECDICKNSNNNTREMMMYRSDLLGFFLSLGTTFMIVTNLLILPFGIIRSLKDIRVIKDIES
jgi:hypothetical protein